MPDAVDSKLLEKNNAWKSFAQILHLIRQSSGALEGINTLGSGNTLTEWFCSGLLSKENMVIKIILDIDGTTSWKFLKLFNRYLTLDKGTGCGCEDTTPGRGGNISTMHI